MMRYPTFLLAIALLLTASPTSTQTQQSAQRIAPAPGTSGEVKGNNNAVPVAAAVRAQRAPVIDGRLDDEVWASAVAISDFEIYAPTEGGKPRVQTEARVAYDPGNLYVVVRSFDPHPDSIIARLSRRDVRTESDEIKVMIDGYHDRRSGFVFALNPVGVKRDIYTFNDGDEDLSWDGVWEGASRIDSLGWVAEFKIPLSQIRYPKSKRHTFGIMITRQFARANEYHSWPLLRASKGGLASQFGDVGGIEGLDSPRRLEVVPYTVGRTLNAPVASAGSTIGYRQRTEATAGADLKLGLTSNLTLDATVNPDFGQVEADPSVLNLGTAETFYPEKRPFFLEGQGIFRFDVNCNDGICSGLFYSRRIGRAPQLSGDYEDPGNPAATTILGAAKLTGQLRNGISVGLLDAVTQREVAPGDVTIEPQTNYLVARLQKDARGGATGIGAMFTAVNRSTDTWTAPVLRREAYAAGINFRHQFFKRNYEINGYAAQTLLRGSAEAIDATQTSWVHLYQRPDDDLLYDPTRTSLGGTSYQLYLNKRGGGNTRLSTGYTYFSPGFDINDAGYLSRANQQMQSLWWQYADRKPKHFWRFWNVNVNQWIQWSAAGLRTEVGGNLNTHMELKNSVWLHLGQGGNALVRSDCDNCSRGGPALRMSPSYWGWAGIEGDSRRTVSPNFFVQWGWGDERRSHSWSIDPGVELKVASRFSVNVGMSYRGSVDARQWYDNFGDPGHDTTHYTFARLDRRTMSMTTRLNFTATPTLSLQVYAQPYTTAGSYTDWSELASPRAARFDDRYRPYRPGENPEGFNFKQLRSNTVLRWEYRPGSVLYVVWAQERTQDDRDRGTFEASRDYRNLFKAHPTNVFLVKGSYWVSF